MPMAVSAETVPRMTPLISRGTFMHVSFSDDHFAAPVTCRQHGHKRDRSQREITSTRTPRSTFAHHQPPDAQSNQEPKCRPDEIMVQRQPAGSQNDSFAERDPGKNG